MLKIKQARVFMLIIHLFPIIILSAGENRDLQISLFTMVYSITANENISEVHFLTHVPIITDDSMPLYLQLSEDGNYNRKVSDFTFRQVREDFNLIRFELKDCLQGEKTFVAFDVYTLKKISDYQDMPDSVAYSAYAELPDNPKYYLQPSSSIQSDHKEIKTKAFEFFYGSWLGKDVIEIIDDIIHFTGIVIIYQGGGQTAVDTLRNGHAACTGKANLAAALCRSLGIPTRVLFVLPTHYITEIWIPDYGWVRGESTLGTFPDAKEDGTVQWILNVDDENYAGDHFGVHALWGFEELDINATWLPEYSHINQPGRHEESFVSIEGDIDANKPLFEKGSELWRLFCHLKNSGPSEAELAVFWGYQKLYLESLLVNDIQNALRWADLAVKEGKRILGLPDFPQTRRSRKER